MKRTKSINLDRMRKSAHLGRFKPIVYTVAAATLAACGNSSRDAQVYQDVAACVRDNPELGQQCEAAYQKALTDSYKSGPKYRNERECVEEFGSNNCVVYKAPSGQSWFMPAVAGYLFARALDRRNFYHSAPLYTSHSLYSPFYGRWTTVDGSLYGRRQYGRIKVNEKVFDSKPPVTRTISRGGFGSTVAAKAKWGGSSSRSHGGSFRGGWGG